MKDSFDVVVIGAGVVGLAIAYELSSHFRHIAVVEKNTSLAGPNQSVRNAGVIHGGIYYEKEKEPLKAKLCVEGNSLLYAFCKKYGVPHANVGKLVVAVTEKDEEYLAHVLAVARQNGVPGVRMVTAREAAAMEPAVVARNALYVPTSGILAPEAYIGALAAAGQAAGVSVRLAARVTGIDPASGTVTVRNGGREWQIYGETVINAAGLWSDDIGKMIDSELPYRIEPVRGELAKFACREGLRISMNIYPAPYGYYNDTGEKADVPYAEYARLLAARKITRTVGVHLTPSYTRKGNGWKLGAWIHAGPAKSVGYGKEEYKKGLRPKASYIKKIKQFFPQLAASRLSPAFAGIMAVLPGQSDFVICKDAVHPDCVQCIGIDSPGLTASLAIARFVRQLL